VEIPVQKRCLGNVYIIWKLEHGGGTEGQGGKPRGYSGGGPDKKGGRNKSKEYPGTWAMRRPQHPANGERRSKERKERGVGGQLTGARSTVGGPWG